MPRLRNRSTGVVVNVSDETAGGLGAEWEPADKLASTATDKPVARKAPAKAAKTTK